MDCLMCLLFGFYGVIVVYVSFIRPKMDCNGIKGVDFNEKDVFNFDSNVIGCWNGSIGWG